MPWIPRKTHTRVPSSMFEREMDNICNGLSGGLTDRSGAAGYPVDERYLPSNSDDCAR